MTEKALDGAAGRSVATDSAAQASISGGLPRTFRVLWTAETVSLVGTQITLVAIPLTAALTLGANQLVMGLLTAMGWVPIILFGLVAGTVVDRHSRWHLMLSSNLARAAVLGVVPVLAAFDGLSLAALLIVAFCAGVMNVLFDVAYQSFVPEIVPRSQLTEANSRYELSRSAAQLTGPLVGGVLASALAPAYAVGIDAASFALAAVGLCFVPRRRGRHDPTAPSQRSRFRDDFVIGQLTVWKSPGLRLIVLSGAITNIFMAGIDALLVLFITRSLGYNSLIVGVSLGSAGAGALAGALSYSRLAARIGQRGCILAGLVGLAGGALLLPIAATFAPIFFLLVSQVLLGVGSPILNIALITIRQQVAPPQSMGRVNASARVLIMSSLPVGSIALAGIAQVIGTTPALWLAAIGEVLFMIIMVPRLKRLIADEGAVGV